MPNVNDVVRYLESFTDCGEHLRPRFAVDLGSYLGDSHLFHGVRHGRMEIENLGLLKMSWAGAGSTIASLAERRSSTLPRPTNE